MRRLLRRDVDHAGAAQRIEVREGMIGHDRAVYEPWRMGPSAGAPTAPCWIGPVVDDLEGAAPARRFSWSRSSSFQRGVGRAGDEPVGAVVGDEHPVAPQRLEHDPRLRR